MNHHHQVSTPRSSLSQKEEIPLSQKLPNGIAEKRPSIADENSESEKILSTNSVVSNNNNVKLNGKYNIKRERSPITAIKEKLNAINPISQPKIMNHKFRSLSDLCESKFTEIESLHHSEQIDRV